MQDAEAKCCQIDMGSVKWSPQYSKSSITLEYWLQRRSYHKGLHSNVRLLITLQRKAGNIYHPDLSLEEMNEIIVLAYEHRRNCKKKYESLSLEYRTQLANAKDDTCDCSAAAYTRSLNNIEASRRLFQNIRHMEGNTRAGPHPRLE